MRPSALAVLVLLSNLYSQKTQPISAPETAKTELSSALQALGGKAALERVADAKCEGTVTLAESNEKHAFRLTVRGKVFEQQTDFKDGTEILIGSDKGGLLETARQTMKLHAHVTDSHAPAGFAFIALAQRLEKSILEEKRNAPDHTVFVLTSGEDELDKKIHRQEWVFDKEGMPRGVKYFLPDNHNAHWLTPAEDRFSDFREVDGIRVPFVIETHIDGKLFRTIKLESVVLNSGATVRDWRQQ